MCMFTADICALSVTIATVSEHMRQTMEVFPSFTRLITDIGSECVQNAVDLSS